VRAIYRRFSFVRSLAPVDHESLTSGGRGKLRHNKTVVDASWFRTGAARYG
jgi:hypothetical protein